MTVNKTSRTEILQRIIAVAVDGWGAKAVFNALNASLPPEERISRSKGQRTKSKKRLPEAIEMVKRLQSPPERKKLLLDLAGKFDKKAFLPTLADAKNFLEMRGVHSTHLKTRPQMFRAIFPILQDTSDEGLARLLRGSGRSGPAQLGPLADAIRETGSQLRGPVDRPDPHSSREPDQPHQQRSRV